jgi:hypothetical protein
VITHHPPDHYHHHHLHQQQQQCVTHPGLFRLNVCWSLHLLIGRPSAYAADHIAQFWSVCPYPFRYHCDNFTYLICIWILIIIIIKAHHQFENPIFLPEHVLTKFGYHQTVCLFTVQAMAPFPLHHKLSTLIVW